MSIRSKPWEAQEDQKGERENKIKKKEQKETHYDKEQTETVTEMPRSWPPYIAEKSLS